MADETDAEMADGSNGGRRGKALLLALVTGHWRNAIRRNLIAMPNAVSRYNGVISVEIAVE